MSDLRTTSPLAPIDFTTADVRRVMTAAPEQDDAAGPAASSLPPLADLPELRPDADWLKDNHIVGFRDNSAISRPFTLLRGQITDACAQHGFSLIGVVSAAPGEGKSFLAANLAAALSRLPQAEVCLLDLDLRRPSLGRLFGIEPELGLESYFRTGAPSLTEIGRRVVGTSLGIFPSAATTTDVVGTLHSARFEQLMGGLAGKRGAARIVICDLPPVFVGDDAMAVARHLDAYIHVVGSGQSTTRQFEELSRLLKDTHCLGSVLNRYIGGPFDPYGYGAASKAYDRYFSDPD